MGKDMTRATLLNRGAVAAGGLVVLGFPSVARAASRSAKASSSQLGEIYQLQANFHLAKSHQDIELMVSLWTEDCTFTFAGTTYNGRDAVRTFFLGSGSWLHKRLSLVPSFKDQIAVHGDSAYLYFECHDIALDTNDPGGPLGSLVTHLYNAGTLRRRAGNWQFQEMHFGVAGVSVDTIYFP
jgi:ketosteroid isomerase-like protein